MIENNLYSLMSTAESKTLPGFDTMDFVLNLEVLNWCAHHCKGCFVRRRNMVDDINLDTALTLAEDMHSHGLRFREVIISPTDIFSAKNAEEILTSPTFHKLMRVHPKTRITTTAMFDNMDWEQFERIFAILDNTDYFKSDMILEFLVPMDTTKMLARDPQYFRDFHKALDYLKTNTPKIVDWSFVVNVHDDEVLTEHFDELTKIAHEEFNTIIEFLPSFFRTGNDLLIKEHLTMWSEFLATTVNESNYKDIMLTIANKHHNGFNTLVVNYKKNKFYISPFIYEQILTEYSELEIPELTAKSVMDTSVKLTTDQFNYATKTTECADCEWLSTCVGRNVLSFMEIKNIQDCIYPKTVLRLYENNPDVATLPPRVIQCS